MTTTMELKDRVVLYHADCQDGFTAAWIAWSRWGDEGTSYVPVRYDKPPPDGLDDREVWILDFSYPRAVLLDLADRAMSVMVLDHHKTAEADLKDLENDPRAPLLVARDRMPTVVFDMHRSGAGITWDVLFDEVARPAIVDHVEDRDLWRFRLPQTREITAYMFTLEKSFQGWEMLRVALEGPTTRQQIVTTGEGLLLAQASYVKSMKKHARLVICEGYIVPLVNAPPVYISDLLHGLAEEYPFAIGWFERSDGVVIYSLRSGGEIDVSAIAKTLGGGGHKGAAGFSKPDRTLPFSLAGGAS